MFWLMKWGSHRPTVIPPKALPLRHTQLRLQQVATCMQMSRAAICGHHSIFLNFSADALQANSCKSIIATGTRVEGAGVFDTLPAYFRGAPRLVKWTANSQGDFPTSQDGSKWQRLVWFSSRSPNPGPRGGALGHSQGPYTFACSHWSCRSCQVDFPRSWWTYHQKTQDGVDVCQDFPIPLWLQFGCGRLSWGLLEPLLGSGSSQPAQVRF